MKRFFGASLVICSVTLFVSIMKAEAANHVVDVDGQVEENITLLQLGDRFDVSSNLKSGAKVVQGKIDSENVLIICANI